VSNHIWALVVEGDAHSLMMIGSILRDLDIFYKRNTTGAQVVEKAEVMEPQPDFILLDLDLPQGDAFSIVRSLKEHPDLCHIPVIAISDDSSHATADRVRHAGFNGFIAKPLPRRQFGDLVEQVLQGQHVWSLPV